MDRELSLKEIQKEFHGSLRNYLTGFLASLFLTTLSFSLVEAKVFDSANLLYIIAGLALLQATLQLIFFLHLGKEGKPYWETLIFFFMLLVFLIITCGSLWIMRDLDMRMMGPMHD